MSQFEDLGLIPMGDGAFFLFLSTFNWCVLIQVPLGDAVHLNFLKTCSKNDA